MNPSAAANLEGRRHYITQLVGRKRRLRKLVGINFVDFINVGSPEHHIPGLQMVIDMYLDEESACFQKPFDVILV